ncbi:hypothetical protein ACR78H_22285 [Sphingobacterium siyangense]
MFFSKLYIEPPTRWNAQYMQFYFLPFAESIEEQILVFHHSLRAVPLFNNSL